MREQNWTSDPSSNETDHRAPAGVLQRALYLWERQPPGFARQAVFEKPTSSGPLNPADLPLFHTSHLTSHSEDEASHQQDSEIEDQLKRHATRLTALERVIPGDRRLDPPRFSLMMLNSFLGRSLTEGIVSARLPGLMSICQRIDSELADLEFEYPQALDEPATESHDVPLQIREEMRAAFADLKSNQKAQHRQILSSLSALHAAIAELRAERHNPAPQSDNRSTETVQSPTLPHVDDFARPLIDPERLVDPRPVLAAARAAALRVNLENESAASDEAKSETHLKPAERPYRSVLLGAALLGLLVVVFGREAIQFMSATPLTTGSLAHP